MMMLLKLNQAHRSVLSMNLNMHLKTKRNNSTYNGLTMFLAMSVTLEAVDSDLTQVFHLQIEVLKIGRHTIMERLS